MWNKTIYLYIYICIRIHTYTHEYRPFAPSFARLCAYSPSSLSRLSPSAFLFSSMSTLTNCTYPTSPWCEGHRTRICVHNNDGHHSSILMFFPLSLFLSLSLLSSRTIWPTLSCICEEKKKKGKNEEKERRRTRLCRENFITKICRQAHKKRWRKSTHQWTIKIEESFVLRYLYVHLTKGIIN